MKSLGLPDLFKPPKGLLLHGSSGTGKTRLMKCLAKLANCSILEVNNDILLKR
jgi:ATP-dependent 26S proteasome regulatory subunit